MIEIEEEEWDHFVGIVAQKGMHFPVGFSCNSRREIWYGYKKGFTRPEDREHVDMKSLPFLNQALDFVLEYKPLGGRFYLDSRQLKIAEPSKGTGICEISIIKSFNERNQVPNHEIKPKDGNVLTNNTLSRKKIINKIEFCPACGTILSPCRKNDNCLKICKNCGYKANLPYREPKKENGMVMVCLANSRKNRNRCVAGKVVSESNY